MSRVLYRALGKAFAEGWSGTRQRKAAVTAPAPGTESLPRAVSGGPRQRIILFFLKIFAEGLQPWPSAKKCCRNFIFLKKIFAKGNGRQRTLLCRGPWSLPSAKRQKFNFFLFFAFHRHKHFIYISHITHFVIIYHNHNCEPQMTIYYNDKLHVHHHSHVYYDKLMKSKHKS